jgi:hypothetical protein
MVDEYGGGVIGDRERFTGGECGKSGAGKAERTTIVGVCGGEMVTRVDSFFHETATVFTSSYCVFIF